MYEVIEQGIRSKASDFSKCEDGIYISDAFAAVIDGVTSKGELLWNGRTSGALAKDVLLECLKTLRKDITAGEAVQILNGALYEAEKEREDEEEVRREERLMAAVIIYSDFYGQIWSFGDCQCLINGELFSHSKRIDTMLAEVRSLYNRGRLEAGRTLEELREHDAGREYILPLLKLQLQYANTEDYYGYDILDGYQIHPERVVIHQLKEGDMVVLASDGYPKLRETLEASEAELERLIREDPLCIFENRGTKGIVAGNNSFDDRSYLRFRVRENDCTIHSGTV